jgi:predicted O-methyltransferase YrrM
MDHFYDSVPGWAAFTSLYSKAVVEAPRDRPSIFVEIGSWLGRSAAFMGVEIKNSGKPIILHCVDPWSDGGPDLRDTGYFKDLKTPVYETFCKNTEPVADVLRLHRMPSLEGAKQFEDGTVDFLMIDGDHNYPAVRDDIQAWLPKMRKGGLISGDDYLWPGVYQSCAEVFGKDGVEALEKKHTKNYRNSVSYWWKRL